jgi:hypothetical protein
MANLPNTFKLFVTNLEPSDYLDCIGLAIGSGGEASNDSELSNDSESNMNSSHFTHALDTSLHYAGEVGEAADWGLHFGSKAVSNSATKLSNFYTKEAQDAIKAKNYYGGALQEAQNAANNMVPGAESEAASLTQHMAKISGEMNKIGEGLRYASDKAKFARALSSVSEGVSGVGAVAGIGMAAYG